MLGKDNTELGELERVKLGSDTHYHSCTVKCLSCQVEMKVILEIREVRRYAEVVKEVERGEIRWGREDPISNWVR